MSVAVSSLMYQVACVLPLSCSSKIFTISSARQAESVKKSALNQTTSLVQAAKQRWVLSLKKLFLPGFIKAWRSMCRNQKEITRARREITRKVPLWRGVFRVLIFVILTWTCVRFLSFPIYISACRRQAHGCCERTMDVCLQGAGDSANKKTPLLFCTACACWIYARLCTPQWNIKASLVTLN